MICTRCQGTGFLNIEQLPKELQDGLADSTFKYLSKDIKYKVVRTDSWYDLVLKWINNNEEHDVIVCDCCGNGEDWYYDPGEHHECNFGKNDVYAYNGGLPECY
jgi:hypothetical protein